MWANDFRFSSHRSHFCALRPMLKRKVQHLPVVPRHPDRLGHLAEHLAGHSLDHRAVQAGQLRLGILGLPDMMSPPINCSRHRDTGHTSNVTQEPDKAVSGD